MERLDSKINSILKSDLIFNEKLRDEILNIIRKKCNQCNSIPIECALQPHCGDRKLLRAQIDMGVPREMLPQFCYEQQIQTIVRFMNGQVNLIDPVDVKIFLNDFLRKIIKEKKNKFRNSDNLYSKLVVRLAEYGPDNFYSVRDSDEEGLIIFLLNDSIYVLDFEKQLAIINYHDSYPQSDEELKMILNLLTQRYTLDYKIKKRLLGWWLLSFTFPNEIKIDEKKINSLKNELRNFTGYVNFLETYNNYLLKVDIKTPKSMNWEKEKLPIKDLKGMFKIINQFKE
ncbi:MAG: hypothetical protein EU547_05050 [Promethearchaeota archaeon]|nr:MAG: hypothetical protein EU547_05050 [Candidatus Lokiarchaeota archaeon]